MNTKIEQNYIASLPDTFEVVDKQTCEKRLAQKGSKEYQDIVDNKLIQLRSAKLGNFKVTKKTFFYVFFALITIGVVNIIISLFNYRKIFFYSYEFWLGILWVVGAFYYYNIVTKINKGKYYDKN